MATHSELIEWTRALIAPSHTVILREHRCRNEKVADLASLDCRGYVWAWECKTRANRHERDDALRRFMAGFDFLTMVYPAGTDLAAILSAPQLEYETQRRRVGLLTISADRWWYVRPPLDLHPSGKIVPTERPILRELHDAACLPPFAAASS